MCLWIRGDDYFRAGDCFRDDGCSRGDNSVRGDADFYAGDCPRENGCLDAGGRGRDGDGYFDAEGHCHVDGGCFHARNWEAEGTGQQAHGYLLRYRNRHGCVLCDWQRVQFLEMEPVESALDWNLVPRENHRSRGRTALLPETAEPILPRERAVFLFLCLQHSP